MAYTVNSYMDKTVNTIREEATVTEAAKAMAEKQIDYLIVLKEGKPVGIVTERDFVNKVLARETNPSLIEIKAIMSTPLITIDPDEDLLRASDLMRNYKIRKLPVTRDGIIYGILTATNIAQKCALYVDRTIKDIVRWTAPLGV